MRTCASLKVRKRNVPKENKRSCEHTLSYLETPSGRVSVSDLSTIPFPRLLLLCHYIFTAFFKPLPNAGNHPLHFTLSQTGRTQSEKSPPWLNAILHDIGGAVRKEGLLFFTQTTITGALHARYISARRHSQNGILGMRLSRGQKMEVVGC
jgi:hypothetical protein